MSAAVGHRQLIAMLTGSYDSAPDQGLGFRATVEGELWHRVAVEVGLEYDGASQAVYRSVGVRVGLLRQERYGLNLGLVGEYKSVAFAHASDSFEMGVVASHHWHRFGLSVNALYGQGLDPGERDLELRAAFLYFLLPRLNLGLDARGHLDLSDESVARDAGQAPATVELVGCALAQFTVAEHVVLLAEVGKHVVIGRDGAASSGDVVLFGVAAAY